MPGTDVCIGDDPAAPLPPGEVGPIWVKTPWYMEGYGYPPELEPVDERHGWKPTRDIGRMDDAGYLYFLGRMDDCVKTGAGYLVNMAEVATALAGHPAVVAAEVVAIDGGAGPALGALLETAGSPSADEIRDHAARHLPPWSRPRVIRFIDQLPRLPGGKVDRLACRTLLR
jgi:acyl-CoA synthetase (AMP-forming)/AMP-acid ligase II